MMWGKAVDGTGKVLDPLPGMNMLSLGFLQDLCIASNSDFWLTVYRMSRGYHGNRIGNCAV